MLLTSQLLCCVLLTLTSIITSKSIITHFQSRPAGCGWRLLTCVTPARRWVGNSSGHFGWLLYLSSIFNSLQSMLMTLDICLISLHTVTLSLARSSHTLEPSPKLHPILRLTICSGESQFQISCPVAKSGVGPYASYSYSLVKYIHLPMLQFPKCCLS